MTEVNETAAELDSAPEVPVAPFPPAVMEYLAPTSQAQRDDELTSLLRNDYIYRTITLAPRVVMTIRDIKTRQFLSARRMSQYVRAGQTGQHDSISAAQYELAFSMSAYSVAGKDMVLPDLDSANADTAEAAFRSRLDIINAWPMPIWNRALNAFQVLMTYINDISSPESLVDFSTAPQEA